MARIYEWLKALTERRASDLHLAAGRPAAMRIDGDLGPVPGAPPIGDAELRHLMREVVTPAQWSRYTERCDLDFACELPGIARFRGNYFMQETGVGAVFRQIPENIVPIEELGLPPVLARFAELSSGLVLVTGPTGSGKSTTLAAIIDRINRTRACHIVTIEDPVEFVHTDRQSIISHREVGADTTSFADGLQAALHEDADVVLVGEMRDLETMEMAIMAASMGILVFATLHTSSAVKSLDRIIDAFSAEQQPQVRETLADCLMAVASQVLIKRADGKGRVAAIEILLRTTAVPAAIREGNIGMLNTVISGGRRLGMQAMDDTLAGLLERGEISGSDAYMKAQDKRRFAQHAG